MSLSHRSYDGGSYVSLEEGPELDVLSEILQAIRLTASSYFCIEFSAPWGFNEPKTDCGTFHVVVRGEAWVSSPTLDEPIHLHAGDIIAFPTGLPHNISDESQNRIEPGIEVLEHINKGINPFVGSSDCTTLLCGYFQYEQQSELPLLKDMPEVLHIKADNNPQSNWLDSLVKTIAHETRSQYPGGAAVINRLTEVLVIQLLRWHVCHQRTTQGYFTALADDKLSRALVMMHKSPETNWTVEGLGKAIGMSRSAFANHFSDVVGMAPLTYLRIWRMHLAYELLTETRESMLNIAEKVGYKSEAAFGKAFKKTIGKSPGVLRKKA